MVSFSGFSAYGILRYDEGICVVLVLDTPSIFSAKKIAVCRNDGAPESTRVQLQGKLEMVRQEVEAKYRLDCQPSFS